MNAKTGFGAMTRERNREVASAGAKRAHQLGRANKFTSDKAREAGLKGGAVVAARPGHMAEIGAAGGRKTARDRDYMRAIGAKGGRAPKKRNITEERNEP